jgi:hypothetical protein
MIKEIDGLQHLYTKDAKAVVTEEKKKNEWFCTIQPWPLYGIVIANTTLLLLLCWLLYVDKIYWEQLHYVFNPEHYIGIVLANTTLLYK